MIYPPVIVTCALVGAELSRQETPYLPLTPQEIIESGLAAARAGAAILHIHVRDKKGKPTLSLKVLKNVFGALKKERPDLILQVSTGGSVKDSFQNRIKVLGVASEMASLSMGTTNFGKDVFLNPRPFISDLAAQMKEKQILPELEIFNLAMLEDALRLKKKGEVPKNAPFNFVLGVPGALAATQDNLKLLSSKLSKRSTWFCTCVGRKQFPMVKNILALGGNLRVGMEDNIYLSQGRLAKTNADLVEKTVSLIHKNKKLVATPQQARKRLGL